VPPSLLHIARRYRQTVVFVHATRCLTSDKHKRRTVRHGTHYTAHEPKKIPQAHKHTTRMPAAPDSLIVWGSWHYVPNYTRLLGRDETRRANIHTCIAPRPWISATVGLMRIQQPPGERPRPRSTLVRYQQPTTSCCYVPGHQKRRVATNHSSGQPYQQCNTHGPASSNHYKSAIAWPLLITGRHDAHEMAMCRIGRQLAWKGFSK
jgi:hypothetical protein